MGTFGHEFTNVLEVRPPLNRVGDQDVRGPLQLILDAASTGLNAVDMSTGTGNHAPGGIVYLPPGRYLIRRNAATPTSFNYDQAVGRPDLFIPKNVLLWFAPGAVLLLDPTVVVRIDGGLRAEPTRIFESQTLRFPGQRPGRVVFWETRVPELYPEWWGAVSRLDELNPLLPQDNAPMIMDCLRAAHTDRTFAGRNYPAIPVVLRGEYFIERELVIEPKTASLIPGDAPGTFIPDPFDTRWFDVSGSPKFDGIVLLGRRATGSSGTVPPALSAAGTAFLSFGENHSVGRALLRIVGLHGSRIEGISFNASLHATDAAMASSACVQLTGNGARSTTFKDCAFNFARHVLLQLGDYVITFPDGDSDARHWYGASDRRLPYVLSDDDGHPMAADGNPTNGGWDLSGLSVENCTFQSRTPDPGSPATIRQILGEPSLGVPGTAHRMVAINFHAFNTLPMILDHCTFTGPMAACIEAYGGTMIIRGGTAQNQLHALEYTYPSGESIKRDRPRGGVDIFIGDVPLVRSPNFTPDPTNPTRYLPDLLPSALPPTGITVIGFASQSNQFMDTFRHISGALGRVAFSPTILQGVVHNITTGSLSGSSAAPSAIFWSGPGIQTGVNSGASTAGTLTLVGCRFSGPRPVNPSIPPLGQDVPSGGAREPSGVVVVDSLAFLVGDIDTALAFSGSRDSSNVFAEFNRMAMPGTNRYRNLPLERPQWYRKM